MVQEAPNMNAKLIVKQTQDANVRLGNLKLSSTNAMGNQLMETLKQPTGQTQQERSHEPALPTDKRPKRFIRKTEKAIEAAEVEQFIISPVKCNKRKEQFIISPVKCNKRKARLVVRIPLKLWEEEKENKTPDNIIQESSFAMRNEVRDKEERGKEGDKTQKSRLVCNPVREVDLTPSYCILPVKVHFLCAMSQKIWRTIGVLPLEATNLTQPRRKTRLFTPDLNQIYQRTLQQRGLMGIQPGPFLARHDPVHNLD